MNTRVRVDETEVIEGNRSPVFAKTIKIDFIFEKRQFFKIEVISSQSSSGEAVIELGKLIGSKMSQMDLDLSRGGKVRVRAEKVSKTNDLVTLEFSCQGLSGFNLLWWEWVYLT